MRITLFYLYCFILCLCSALLANAQTLPWTVPSDWAKKKNAVASNSTSIAAGKKIYTSSCSPCHGEKGKGNGMLALSLNPHPANHTSKKFQQQKDGEIFYKINTGRNAMPPFRQTLSENEIWSIVDFIRTLETKTQPPSVKEKTVTSANLIKTSKDTISAQQTKSVSITSDTNILSHPSPELQTIILKSGNNDSASVIKNKIADSTTLVLEIPDSISQNSQNENPPNERRKFLLTGSAHTNLIIDGNKFKSAGFEVGFLPVLLWKPSKRLFFESHLHITIGSGSPQANTSMSGMAGMGLRHSGMTTTPSSASPSPAPAGSSIMVAYANLVYFVNPYITFTGGMFLSPFGIYAERLHAEWINKLPDAPEGMGHTDQMIPETELGIQLRGGIPIRKFKINYSIYISNGPALIDDTSSNAGKLTYDNLIDNNTNKALGGRLGLMPIPGNPSLEIGLYAQHGRVGKEGTMHSGVNALLYGADITWYHYFEHLKGTIDVKGQYCMVSVDKIYYKADPMLTLNVPAEDVNLGDSTYRFNNVSKIYFLTTAYRPIASENFMKNTEYIFRYDILNSPCSSRWGNAANRWTLGIAYWLESRSAVKLSYSIEKIQNTVKTKNILMMQFVIGL